MFGGVSGEIGGIFDESISDILVNTNGSFRVFIVAMNVLCYDVTPITFSFSYACPTRSNHSIVVVHEVAAIRREVNGLQGSFPISIM